MTGYEWDGSDDAAQVEVEAALGKAAKIVKLDTFMFVFQEQPESGPLRVSILGATADNFGRRYLERRWFTIDALLVRSERTVAPFWGWESVRIESAGQAEIQQAAMCSGFRTVAVVPALSRWSDIRGALYFGSDKVVPESTAFRSQRTELRTLAIDVMNWAVRNAYRRDLGEQFALRPVERAALRCELMGYSTADTAAMLAMSTQEAQYIFRSTQIRMKARSKREAARRALMAGAIGL